MTVQNSDMKHIQFTKNDLIISEMFLVNFNNWNKQNLYEEILRLWLKNQNNVSYYEIRFPSAIEQYLKNELLCFVHEK